MTNHPNRSRKPILRPHEARALRTAVSFMTAGEADGVPRRTIESAETAFSKLCEAPEQSLWIPFSRMELDALWDAIGNGAEAVLQPSSSHSADQRKAFRDASNRIADAGGFGPKF